MERYESPKMEIVELGVSTIVTSGCGNTETPETDS